MKTYKGFNPDMTCRGFQYKEGEEYEEKGDINACENGFHACEYPLDCFGYYNPAQSVFHEVEQSGEISRDNDDSKIASSKIKIGARISIKGLVESSIEYIKERAEKTKSNHSRADKKANSSTGDYSANSSTGDYSANSSTGYYSANSATGYYSANSATGDGSANSSTGNYSANSSTGYYSANSATGYGSANSATGYGSANISTGEECKNNGAGQANISVGWGRDNKCKGAIGSYLVLSEWGDWDGEKYPLLGAQMVYVDGKKIKADTWYQLKGGKFVEVSE